MAQDTGDHTDDSTIDDVRRGIRDLWEYPEEPRTGPASTAYGLPGISWEERDVANELRDPTLEWDRRLIPLMLSASNAGCAISEIAAERGITFKEFEEMVYDAILSVRRAALAAHAASEPVTAEHVRWAYPGCGERAASEIARMSRRERVLGLGFMAGGSVPVVGALAGIGSAAAKRWLAERTGDVTRRPARHRAPRGSRSRARARCGTTTAGSSRGSPRSADDDPGEIPDAALAAHHLHVAVIV